MSNVLQKTMQSLEAALKYNPDSIELQSSLAEVYVRLGRFDRKTMDLCEAVLARQGDNILLQQAQSIGMLIEQSREIEKNLENGKDAPPQDALISSGEILDEYLEQSKDCVDAWIAWTRFMILSGDLVRGRKGLEQLRNLGTVGLDEMYQYSLRHVATCHTLDEEQAGHIAEIYLQLGAESKAIRMFENMFDSGHETIGRILLDLYLRRYQVAQAHGIPEEVRSRLFKLLLDFGDSDTTNQWLRKASMLGWGVADYSRDYAQSLIDDEQLDAAFAVLQRQVMDPQVKDLLNLIATRYENKDEVDKAVSVLRYINDNELVAPEKQIEHESELVRQAELTIADMQMKSGRPAEALNKFISALISSPVVDFDILTQIEDLLDRVTVTNPDPLLRLGMYFRQREDHPKAMSFLNQAARVAPENREVLNELEALFLEVLAGNPDLGQIRMELGELYLKTQRMDQAIAQFEHAAKLPALSNTANRLLAELYLSQNKFTDSLDKYRKLSLKEQDLEQIYELHESLAETLALQEAMMALELIVRVNPIYRDVSEKKRVLESKVGSPYGGGNNGMDPKMQELIGDLAVGRYRYMERLGSGGMGVVHKVFDVRNNQVVAMKILRDSLSGSSKALDRFFREARIAATLNHRHIVQIIDYNISNKDGQSYIAMEYVDGPSMREIIDGSFSETITIDLDYITEILYYSIQVADALEAAHEKGIVHRDIKPDNIMISSSGEAKITDFGIVHIEEATFTPTGAMLGTPRYMAPEQVTGGKINGRSDIYSLGIVLYEALVGSPPFMSGDISYQQVHNDPVPPREINPMIPQTCNDVIMKCLIKDPEARFANANQLKSKLSDLLEQMGGCSKFSDAMLTEFDADTPMPRVPDRITPVTFTNSLSAPAIGSDDELDL